MLLGFFLPVLEYCSAVWCTAADTHLKLLGRVVSGACFIAGGVLNFDLSHRRSVAVKWRSEAVPVGQNLRSISSQTGLQLLIVLVTLTLSHRSFNYDTDHGTVWITLGDWHYGIETFMLGSRFRTHAQSSNTACSTGQSANHLHHRGDDQVTPTTKQCCVFCTRSGVTRSTHFVALYMCLMCQSGLHAVLWSHIGILLRLPAAEPRSTAGLLFPSQSLSGMIWLTQYLMVWDWRVSRADPMPICWPSCSLLFCLQLYSLSLLFLYRLDRLVVWGCGPRTDRVSISLSRPLPTFFNNNNKAPC